MTDTTKRVRTLSGRVVSNKSDKTISVLVERFGEASTVWQVREALFEDCCS